MAIGGLLIYQRGSSNAGGTPSFDGPAFKLGITKYQPKELVEKAMLPLTNYLSTSLEQNVELVVVDDYSNLADKLVRGEIHMAALSSSSYVRAHERNPELAPLAMPVRKGGNTNYEGYILVRKASDIHTIEDLRGKVFCYVNPTSTSGYLYPRAVIREAGLDPDRDFSATRFGGDHLQTLKALHKGACDGAATYATNWHEGGKHDMPPQDFRPIATTDRIPDDAYVLAPSVDAKKSAMVEKALIELEPGSKLANEVLVEPAKDSSQDIVGFLAASDKDYESVREYLRQEARTKEQ